MIVSGKVVQGPIDMTLNFGNGTRAVTNGNDVTVELSLQVSNTLWHLTNAVTITNPTNATTGEVTNTLNFLGRVRAVVYDTNAVSRCTNFVNYVAGTAVDASYLIQTGPGSHTYHFNTGALHGLLWTCNSNNPVQATMTLEANSTYAFSFSTWLTNVLQSLIKL
jgi:hypothetical protein